MDLYRSKTRHTGYTTYTLCCEVLQGTLLCVFHAWKPVKLLDDKNADSSPANLPYFEFLPS